MNDDNVKEIYNNVEELGSFFSFLKKGKIKSNIFSSLKIVQKSLDEIPVLKNDLEDIQKKNVDLNNEFDLHKINSEQEQEQLLNSFESHKKDTLKTLEIKDKEIHKISCEHDDLQTKHLLVSKLLSSKSTNQGLVDYKKVLYNDFMIFANSEESLANEAEAILKLQAIEKELEVITAYPKLHKKNTIAIGGGFSSGKSEFISSFFKSDIKLPIGIEPTTAIPAYVMNSNNDEIIGCSYNGGIVDLKKIDDNFHSKISHGFMKSFDFNLKEIMPYMVFGTKFEYEHICFIDTPGYNPATNNESYTKDDINTAKEFLSNASTLIWLIGADANGTISSSDLDFLSNLDLKDKKLYIVLNKADLRSETDVWKIMEEIQNELDDYDIEYFGISSFSSIQQKEYTFIKQSLFDFMHNCNYESQVHENIVKKLYDVYLMYKLAIMTTKKEKKAIQSHIKSISLDILQEGVDDITKPAFQRLDKLEKIFSIKEEERNLKMLEEVIKKLKISIDSVFENESSIDFEDIKEHEIEIDFDLSIDNGFLEEEINDNKNDDEEKEEKLVELRNILKQKAKNEENNIKSSSSSFFPIWGNQW